MTVPRLYPSADPAFYAQRVLSDIGLTDVPVPVGPILEYFGLGLRSFGAESFTQLPEFDRSRIRIPAFLWYQGDDSLIYVKQDDPDSRKRLSTFHECGHFDIPWHRGSSYFCDCSPVPTAPLQKLENEAFRYASSLMFPRNHLSADLADSDVSLRKLSCLAEKYEASFSAAVITFVESHSGLVAVVYLEENPQAAITQNPFRTRYSVKSRRFHRYWRPNDEIGYDSLLNECFVERKFCSGYIPARVFGSSKGHSYYVQAKPYGSEQICVLLQMEDSQQRLF